jgi:chromosome segregation ATPase
MHSFHTHTHTHTHTYLQMDSLKQKQEAANNQARETESETQRLRRNLDDKAAAMRTLEEQVNALQRTLHGKEAEFDQLQRTLHDRTAEVERLILLRTESDSRATQQVRGACVRSHAVLSREFAHHGKCVAYVCRAVTTHVMFPRVYEEFVVRLFLLFRK